MCVWGGEGGSVRATTEEMDVLAIDDGRPIRVDPQELHPRSRLRFSLTDPHRAAAGPLRFGASADTLRSLVASQRHHRLVLTGSTTEEELRVELERDCVSVPPMPVFSADGEETLARLAAHCDDVAVALLNWPRLRRSMHGSVRGVNIRPVWTCGATFFWVQFPRKPLLRDCRSRPLSDMLAIECDRRGRGLPLSPSSEWSAQELEGSCGGVVSDEKEGFGFCTEDTYYRRTGSATTAGGAALLHHLRAELDQGPSEWASGVLKAAKMHHCRLPCLGTLFSTGPVLSIEQRLLSAAMSQRGMRALRWFDEPPPNIKPIVFPTCWCVSGAPVDGPVLYVQMEWA